MTDTAVLMRNAGPLLSNWAFTPSPVTWRTRFARLFQLCTGIRRRPPHCVLVAPSPAARWSIYFIYAPDGELRPYQRFTLNRLKARGVPLFVVIATRTAADIPFEIHALADALIWKGLSGFDFSAYALALHRLAATSPGCEALVMNDSVMGPFGDIDTLVDAAPWALVGFTGYGFVENHIQSYAFVLRNINRKHLAALRTIFPRKIAFNGFKGVVYCQETRFARVANRVMQVGALWYGTPATTGDPTLSQAIKMVEQGFPFLKCSLFGKFAGVQNDAALRDLLCEQGHPLP